MNYLNVVSFVFIMMIMMILVFVGHVYGLSKSIEFPLINISFFLHLVVTKVNENIYFVDHLLSVYFAGAPLFKI